MGEKSRAFFTGCLGNVELKEEFSGLVKAAIALYELSGKRGMALESGKVPSSLEDRYNNAKQDFENKRSQFRESAKGKIPEFPTAPRICVIDLCSFFRS